MTIDQLEVPIGQVLADELISFWESIFGYSFAGQGAILAGRELDHNHDLLFVARVDGVLAGACHLTIDKAHPELGGLGEVAVAPAYRKRGIAGMLCARARDLFLAEGGRALYLGTNPADEAFRVYHRLGWRKLAGANVMALMGGSVSPEQFLVEYCGSDDGVTVSAGSPADRLPMIPFLVCPHNWHVLDANVGLFSTRYAVKKSCMGLYPRYEALRQDGRGDWFAARTRTGQVVGLATVKRESQKPARVDGVIDQRWLENWDQLIMTATRWAIDRGETEFHAHVPALDEDKSARLLALGFRKIGPGDTFNLDGRFVPSVLLSLTSGI